MKVILMQDVAKIGKRGEIAEVPDGYALNQLIPKRMAEAATASNLKRVEKIQAQSAATNEADAAKFTEAGTALQETTLQIAADANEQEHLFKAVNETEIAEAAEAAGITIDPSLVIIGEPIKALGKHEVKLVRGDDSTTFTVEVIKK